MKSPVLTTEGEIRKLQLDLEDARAEIERLKQAPAPGPRGETMGEDRAEKYRRLIEDLEANHLAMTRNRSCKVSIYSRAIDAIRETIVAALAPGPATEAMQRTIDGLVAALGKIACRDDAEMVQARTLHYDMRGIAKAALERYANPAPTRDEER